MEVIGILKTNIKPSAIKTAVGNRTPQSIVFKDWSPRYCVDKKWKLSVRDAKGKLEILYYHLINAFAPSTQF